jgi:hypothetical protein
MMMMMIVIIITTTIITIFIIIIIIMVGLIDIVVPWLAGFISDHWWGWLTQAQRRLDV